MSRAIAAFMILLSPGIGPCLAQEAAPDSLLFEDPAEVVLEGFDTESDDPAALVELLAELAENPVEINTATAEELSRVPGLGAVLALDIVAFREARGPFDTLEGLLEVGGFGEALLRRTTPYLRVEPPQDNDASPVFPSMRGLVAGLRYDFIQRWTRRLDLGRGYDPHTEGSSYLGSPPRLYARLRARYGRQFSLNLTLEKDPGERVAWNPGARQYGFDHVSAHLALRDLGRLKTLILGDFSAMFGQGVALWNGFGSGKSRDAVAPAMRISRGFVPFGSTEENRFFRGFAATVRLTPTLFLSSFASVRRLDASGSTGDSTFQDVRTLSTSGLHRTALELTGRGVLRTTATGGVIEHRGARISLGLATYRTWFALPIYPGDAPYRRYRFSGREYGVYSLFGRLSLKGILVFGEAALTSGGAAGGTGGITFQGTKRASFVVLARHYPRRFEGVYGSVFSERSGNPANESGVYTGLTLTVNDAWSVSGYLDLYRAPWLLFAAPRPSRGTDGLLSVEHRPRPWMSLALQVRFETREQGTVAEGSQGKVLDALVDEMRQSLRLHGSYQFSPALRIRARTEVIRTRSGHAPPGHGLLLYNDLRWRPTPWLRADLRLSFFDTDAYAARVFTYEDDLLYTFSVPSFSGMGRRSYLLLSWTGLRPLTLQAKYAATRYENVTQVGSGLDATTGNRIREVRIQLKWRF